MKIGEREQKLPIGHEQLDDAMGTTMRAQRRDLFERIDASREKNHEGVSSTCTELGEHKNSVSLMHVEVGGRV